MQHIPAFILAPGIWRTWLDEALEVLLIGALAWGAYLLIIRLLHRWERRVRDLPPNDPERQRVYTASTLLRSLCRYGISIIALFMILAALGVNIGPLLAGAGVAGLAIGFGAQTLVKDVIAGFFLLFERLIAVGDMINFRGEVGFVEEVGLRVTKVRKFNGELLIVPNEELRVFGNRNRGFMRALVEVDVAYEQDAERALQILHEVATRWAQERADVVLEPPVVQGILSFGDSGLRLRVAVQVVPAAYIDAELELRRRIKEAFAQHNIDIPFPRRLVYTVAHQPDFTIRS
jgi:small-conductance mechanosensitive channel|nr:MAG: mechanosensitive ion channel protein MscS [Bacteroidota bacterium]